jgi:hypothetical protein
VNCEKHSFIKKGKIMNLVGPTYKKESTTADLPSQLVTSQMGFESDGDKRMLFKSPTNGNVYYYPGQNTGYSGYSGTSGYSGLGVSGYSGIQGYSGYSGSISNPTLIDWSSSLNPQGLSGISAYAHYFLLGKLCILWLALSGVETADHISITLPVACANTTEVACGVLIAVQDNGSDLTTPGSWFCTPASTSCVLYKDCAHGTWYGSGNMVVYGTIIYPTV